MKNHFFFLQDFFYKIKDFIELKIAKEQLMLLSMELSNDYIDN